MLYGRGTERAAVDRLLAAAGEGRAGALVLRGEPGIGKSALLDAAAGAAAGWRVLRAAGVESEARLPHAVLSQLLAPALGELGGLPGPQRAALERTLGLADGPAGDRLLVGLAVLTLLGDLAERQPVLALVDDLQWADPESAAVLRLAARRLGAERVALLLATREDDGPDPAGLPDLRIGPLAEPDAAALLRHLAPELPDPARVLAAAAGNPLALRELPHGADTGALPPAGRLRLAYHGQVSRLPGRTQRWLLLAALEETGALEVLLRAAAESGLDAADLAPAEEQGLLKVDLTAGRVAFRHPLLRSAVADRAPLVDRLAAHRALAAAHGPAEPLRRAWHRALAATGRDADAAGELAAAAGAAAARGGHTGASAAYERAARLSPDPDLARRWTVEAVEAALEAGEVDRAERLALAADRPDSDPVTRAHLLFARGVAEFWRGEHGPAHRRLTEAAALVADPHPGPAARVLVQAVHVAWYDGLPAVRDTLAALTALPLPADDPLEPVVRYLAAALGPLVGEQGQEQGPDAGPAGAGGADVGGAGAGVPTLPEAERAARAAGAEVPVDLALACGAGLVPGHDAEVLDLARRLVREGREAGAFGTLPTLLFFLAEAELFDGRPGLAADHAAEALGLARDTGQPLWTGQLHGFLAYLSAVRGDGDPCREQAAAAFARGGAGAPWARWALGVLDLGAGRAEDAFGQLAALTGGPHAHHVSAVRAVPDLVEAAVRLRRGERTAGPLAGFERWAAQADRPWARALVHRCHALLAPDEFAEDCYLAALAGHAEQPRPWEQARTELLYGEWLRRGRRKAEARAPLRSAEQAFRRLGAGPWAERARLELEATGGPAAAGPERTVAGLTPQESQIVRLAAQGLSNREIAAQLFLSARTVGHHLYKAYPKLGVGSRTDLAGVLPALS
ncbi:helix-turn-helix transcriptional regulator [Kitasatospora cineracea]|uniref:Regulatory LuxR family protein n=1 Tax=Kitasatospora cineracea TaxID=88074 RepID=A0A3N4RX37_9ACTN|nr:LuxR family transcriptional regulator [Kitasatospora cineracea]RPE35315.1 regulatory LuxR family protein [Kitasatospora cineracea]